MATTVKVKRHVLTADDVRARVRNFEAAHPGMNRDNYIDMFRDEHGELQETDEFFAAVRIYGMLDSVDRAEAAGQSR